MKKKYEAPQGATITFSTESSLMATSQIPVDPDQTVVPSSSNEDIWNTNPNW